MDPDPTLRHLFYPPQGYDYLAFRDRLTYKQAPSAWAVDLAMLAYGQDGATPMGWAGVESRLSAAAFSAHKVGDWNGPGTQGFLAVRHDFAVLAFRGTEPNDWIDVLRNLDLRPAAESWQSGFPGASLFRDIQALVNSTAMVHAGFQEALNTQWEQVEALLTTVPPDLPLLLCGHSLGGAMALLTASRLARPESPPAVYTFGCPRVGNREWGLHVLESAAGKIVRFVNDQDIITAVPTTLLSYAHTPDRVFRLHAGGSVVEDTADPPVSALEITAAIGELALWRFIHGNLNVEVEQPRLAAHSPGRYLARIIGAL